MRAPASAYAALGLEPGADRPAIEEAYRRLIKLHHPDRSGGDPSRAAEINRAYFELRRQQEPDPSRPDRPRPRRTAARRRSKASRRKKPTRPRRNKLWPVPILAVAVLLIAERDRVGVEMRRSIAWLADLQVPASNPANAVSADSALFDGPLNDRVIASSIEQAIGLANRGGEDELAAEIRACHRTMRSSPGLAQFDRCAAFDHAVSALSDHEPLSEGGAFSASAVTARQMTAARLLSSDYLAIERRLDRIRHIVALALRPPLPPEVVPTDIEVPAELPATETEPGAL